MNSTFYFSAKSGVNAGVISTIFSTCILFTAILFYVLHGQKLTLVDLFGCLLIIACLVLIGLAGNEKNPDKTDRNNLMLAILFATLTGLMFSINTLNFNYIVNKIGFSPSQMNYDALLLMGILTTPLFFYEQTKNRGHPYFAKEDIFT